MKNAGEPSEPPPGKPQERRTIEELFRDGTEIDEALRRAVREALSRHKKLGNSIAVWRDGKVVIVPPEEIPA
jgi:isoaspartyl peptidase/L-asparaginase-like protein (Ntn-hydrolase superfamily)